MYYIWHTFPHKHRLYKHARAICISPYVGPYSYGKLNYCDRLHILITFIYIITPLLTSTHKPVLARAPSSITNITWRRVLRDPLLTILCHTGGHSVSSVVTVNTCLCYRQYMLETRLSCRMDWNNIVFPLLFLRDIWWKFANVVKFNTIVFTKSICWFPETFGTTKNGPGAVGLRTRQVRRLTWNTPQTCSSSCFHFVGVMLVSCHSAVRLLLLFFPLLLVVGLFSPLFFLLCLSWSLFT